MKTDSRLHVPAYRSGRPCYILDEGLLRRNLALIKRVADEAGVEIILAFKAYALWKTFPVFREYITATTASSLSEARLAYEEFGNKAHTFSPAYTDYEIDEIVRCSSHITFNSLSQYERYRRRVRDIDPTVSIGLRINPEYSEIKTDLYNPCAPGTRFGVTAEKLSLYDAQNACRGDNPQPFFNGFHCHCHCESGADVFARTLVHIKEKFSRWFDKIEWINFGGGHLMTSSDYDIPLLIRTLKDFRAEYPHLKVILEPGSAFAWQTGYLVAQVTDIVEDRGICTAVLNVSFTCHMPDCLEMPYMPAVRGAEIVDEKKYVGSQSSTNVYRLGGCSCLAGDFLGMWRFDHELQVGENIIFEDMLHYTTVKTNMFNGITHPSIALRRTDGVIEVLREYSYADYRDRMD